MISRYWLSPSRLLLCNLFEAKATSLMTVLMMQNTAIQRMVIVVLRFLWAGFRRCRWLWNSARWYGRAEFWLIVFLQSRKHLSFSLQSLRLETHLWRVDCVERITKLECRAFAFYTKHEYVTVLILLKLRLFTNSYLYCYDYLLIVTYRNSLIPL